MCGCFSVLSGLVRVEKGGRWTEASRRQVGQGKIRDGINNLAIVLGRCCRRSKANCSSCSPLLHAKGWWEGGWLVGWVRCGCSKVGGGVALVKKWACWKTYVWAKAQARLSQPETGRDRQVDWWPGTKWNWMEWNPGELFRRWNKESSRTIYGNN